MRDAAPLLLTLPDALVRLVLPDEAELLRVVLLLVLRTVLPELDVLRLELLEEAALLRLAVLEEAGVVVVVPVLRLTVVVPEGVEVLIRVSADPDELTRL